jgi:hypothetical protein
MSSKNVNEPIFNVAQLAYVELLTPGPKGTLWYFKDLFGMRSPAPDSVKSFGTPAAQEQLVPRKRPLHYLKRAARRARVRPKP